MNVTLQDLFFCVLPRIDRALLRLYAVIANLKMCQFVTFVRENPYFKCDYKVIG